MSRKTLITLLSVLSLLMVFPLIVCAADSAYGCVVDTENPIVSHPCKTEICTKGILFWKETYDGTQYEVLRYPCVRTDYDHILVCDGGGRTSEKTGCCSYPDA